MASPRGGGTEWSRPRTSLQDQFLNSFKSDEKLIGGVRREDPKCQNQFKSRRAITNNNDLYLYFFICDLS